MMVTLTVQQEDAARKKEVVEVEKQEAQISADQAEAIKKETQRDLAEALPALESAVKALKVPCGFRFVGWLVS